MRAEYRSALNVLIPPTLSSDWRRVLKQRMTRMRKTSTTMIDAVTTRYWYKLGGARRVSVSKAERLSEMVTSVNARERLRARPWEADVHNDLQRARSIAVSTRCSYKRHEPWHA